LSWNVIILVEQPECCRIMQLPFTDLLVLIKFEQLKFDKHDMQ